MHGDMETTFKTMKIKEYFATDELVTKNLNKQVILTEDN